jgi:hypothetical protein
MKFSINLPESASDEDAWHEYACRAYDPRSHASEYEPDDSEYQRVMPEYFTVLTHKSLNRA